MPSLKLIIFIGLISSFCILGLVTDTKASIFDSPDFYSHGAFSNADFRLDDNYHHPNNYDYNHPKDYGYYSNYNQNYGGYSDCTVVNDNEYYRERWGYNE